MNFQHRNSSLSNKISLKLIVILCGITLSACTISPSKRFDQFAISKGLIRSNINTNQFSVASYSNLSPDELKSSSVLNIYLSGDGTPWITPNHKSIDPTPRKHIALNLLLQDQNPSVYIGRPCYHIIATDTGCSSKWWTSHRYSNEVVTALHQAINFISTPSQRLNIYGFSGGGTLAMLITPRLFNEDGKSKVDSVITIGANLDIQQWAVRHNYSPLFGSINPIQQAPLDSSIKVIHLFGELDTNVDVGYLSKKLKSTSAANVHVIPEFTHHCCWPKIWPQLKDTLK